LKNKKFIYILIPLVADIWGIIGYRIFKAIDGNSTTIPVTSPVPVFTENKDDTGSYELKLNYSDPFLRHVQSSRENGQQEKEEKKKPLIKKTVTKIPLNWPQVIYKGTLKKTGSQKELCILEIDREAFFLVQNQQEKDIKLLKVYPDSVKVSFRGKEERIIRKQPS